MMFLRFAAVCAVTLQASASEVPPDHSPLSLRLNDRKVVASPQRIQTGTEALSESAGSSFRIRGGIEDGGRAELLVIPKGAKGDDVLLSVAVQVEKMGPRKQDMWIRRVQLHGQWMTKKWAFKTGSGYYGQPELYLARYGTSPWAAPVDLLKESDGLLSVAIHDKPVPTRLFQSSTAMDVQLVVGPVIVGVVWKTSNKDGANFNHLDVHLAGLSQVQQELGGLLIGEPDPGDEQVTQDHPNANATEVESPEGSPPEGSPEEQMPAEETPPEDPLLAEMPPPAQPPQEQTLLQAVKSDVSSDYQ